MVIGKIVRFANKREMVGFVGLKLVEGTFIGGYGQDTCLLTEGIWWDVWVCGCLKFSQCVSGWL